MLHPPPPGPQKVVPQMGLTPPSQVNPFKPGSGCVLVVFDGMKTHRTWGPEEIFEVI